MREKRAVILLVIILGIATLIGLAYKLQTHDGYYISHLNQERFGLVNTGSPDYFFTRLDGTPEHPAHFFAKFNWSEEHQLLLFRMAIWDEGTDFLIHKLNTTETSITVEIVSEKRLIASVWFGWYEYPKGLSEPYTIVYSLDIFTAMWKTVQNKVVFPEIYGEYHKLIVYNETIAVVQ